MTPESDYGLDNNNNSFSLVMLPKGHQLMVCGVVPTLNETPVTAMRNLLTNLASDLQYSEFASFSLDIQPFSDHSSNLSSACYVKILSSGDAEPCVDLLEIIMDAIFEAKPGLEVRWSASKKGKSNKHLSCCLLDLYPGVTDHLSIPPNLLLLIKAHIEKKGFKVASIFASFKGPQLIFLLPLDADDFYALPFTDVPAKVSKKHAHIELLKEIPILHPFELVVKGA
jgi:hypothetical protein